MRLMNSSEEGMYTPAEKGAESMYPNSPGLKAWAWASTPRRMDRNRASCQGTTQQNNIKFLPCSYGDDLRESSKHRARTPEGNGLSEESSQGQSHQAMLRNWHSTQGIVTCVSLPPLGSLLCLGYAKNFPHWSFGLGPLGSLTPQPWPVEKASLTTAILPFPCPPPHPSTYLCLLYNPLLHTQQDTLVTDMYSVLKQLLNV